uniref:CCT domain-containing protein n=1 Tax=Globisporangium ultimum (strain ATCC 200006 / CBS 805.95 / DAOM BR144) TaxID=431595 RepID=K3WZ66_GLOUD
MIDTEAADTLLSLSAPDDRKFASPLYSNEMPWHANKKRSFNSFSPSPNVMASSLPTSSSFMQQQAGDGRFGSMSLLAHNIQERPLTSMIPRKSAHRDDDDSDEDMDTDQEDMYDSRERMRYRSPFDGLVAAARDYADVSNLAENDSFTSSSTKSSASRPIMIPMHPNRHRQQNNGATSFRSEFGSAPARSSLSQVKEDSSFFGLDSSPTGVEEDSEWFDSYRESTEYKQRARLASICSSDGGSEYGGLGRKNFEGFLRMDISERDENDRFLDNHNQQQEGMSPPDSRYIGSYSPEARRKRIERFLEKRKHRVWSKKVDYDVRKNFANSRLRVKGRFVKKEDEELLCQLMSFT